METQTTTNQGANKYQTEIISLYRDNLEEVLDVMRSFSIGYIFLGKDQSQRMLFRITYDESQLDNIATIHKGIQELERSTHFKDLIITGLRRLLS